MKKILFALLFVTTTAMADSWYMPNQGNGEIVITDQVCKQEKALKFAYSWTEKISVSYTHLTLPTIYSV